MQVLKVLVFIALMLNYSVGARPDPLAHELISSPSARHASSSIFTWIVPYRHERGPDILNILLNRTLSLGHGVSFRCRVVGNPKPRIKWKKNGVTIAQNKRIKILFPAWGSRLRIRNIQKSDEGVYRCIAKNQRGHAISPPAYVKVKDNKKGRCSLYTGTMCNTNLVYLPSGQSQHQVENSLIKTIKRITSPLTSQHCLNQITRFLCHQHYPSCTLNTNRKPRKVCREDCHELEKRACRRESRKLGSLWREIITCGKLPPADRQPEANCQRVFGSIRHKPSQRHAHLKAASIHQHLSPCIMYTGNICNKYIQDGGLVTIHGYKTSIEAEKGLARLLYRLQGYVSSNCGLYLKKALCFHVFSPCSPGPAPKTKHICRLQCEVLQGRLCSKEFHLAKLFKEDKVNLPRCFALPVGHHGNQCISLGIQVNEPLSNGLDRCSAFLERTENKDFQHSVMRPPLNRTSLPCLKQQLHSISKLPSVVSKLLMNAQNKAAKIYASIYNTNKVYCIALNVTLQTLVGKWRHYHNSLPLPHIRFQPSNLNVPGIEVTIDRFSSIKTIVVPLGSADVYRAHAKFHLENVTFFYRYQDSKGTFMAKGKYRLCESVFDVVMTTQRSGVMTITGNSSSPLDVNTIERVFGLAIPSDMIQDAIRRSELLLMRLMNPTLDAYIENDITVKFTGQSYFSFDGHPTFLEVYGGKVSQSDVLVTSLSTKGVAFNNALRIFTGIDLPSFDWMKHTSNDSQIGVLLSTTKLQTHPNSRYYVTSEPLFSSLAGSIPEGLTIVTQARVPRICNGSRFCEFVKMIFGKNCLFTAKLTLNQNRIVFDVAVRNASHDALLKYKSFKVSLNVVKGNTTLLDVLPFLTFKASVFIHMSKDEKLFFTGQLDYDGLMSKLHVVLQLNKDWVNVLGVKHLTLRNLRASFSIPTDTSNSQTKHVLDAKGDLYFGAGCWQQQNASKKNSCITGQGFLGLSEDISQHYFYAKLGPVTLQQLLEAYNIQVRLPAAVGTIGFPRGLKISVAKTLHDSEGGPLINPGLVMSGRLRILGIETDATVSLSPREFVIDADVTSDPVQLLNEVSPLEHVKQQNKPKLYMKTRMNPTAFLKIHMTGYTRIFGIFDEIHVLVSGEVTQIKMVAEIHKSVYAHMYLTSNYSQRINNTHLMAKIIFKNKLSKLTRLASKHVVNMLENEMSKMKGAEKEVNKRSKDCIRFSKKTCAQCMGQSNCFSTLSTCYKAIARYKRPSTLRSFCQQIAADSRLATNKTCRKFSVLIGKYSNNTPCLAYQEAAKTLQNLQRGLKWVRQARVLVSGNLFNLHSISFEARVLPENLQNTVVDTTFDVTIFGQRNLLKGLKLHLDSLSRLASEIAQKAFLWYSKRNGLYGN